MNVVVRVILKILLIILISAYWICKGKADLLLNSQIVVLLILLVSLLVSDKITKIIPTLTSTVLKQCVYLIIIIFAVTNLVVYLIRR